MPERKRDPKTKESQKGPGTGSAASTGRDAVKERGESIRTEPTSAAGYTDLDATTGALNPTGGGSGKPKR